MYNLYFVTCMYFTFPKYISAQLIFSRMERSRIFISEYTFTSAQKKKKKKKKKTEESVHPRKRAEPLMLWRN